MKLLFFWHMYVCIYMDVNNIIFNRVCIRIFIKVSLLSYSSHLNIITPSIHFFTCSQKILRYRFTLLFSVFTFYFIYSKYQEYLIFLYLYIFFKREFSTFLPVIFSRNNFGHMYVCT